MVRNESSDGENAFGLTTGWCLKALDWTSYFFLETFDDYSEKNKRRNIRSILPTLLAFNIKTRRQEAAEAQEMNTAIPEKWEQLFY